MNLLQFFIVEFLAFFTAGFVYFFDHTRPIIAGVLDHSVPWD